MALSLQRQILPRFGALCWPIIALWSIARYLRLNVDCRGHLTFSTYNTRRMWDTLVVARSLLLWEKTPTKTPLLRHRVPLCIATLIMSMVVNETTCTDTLLILFWVKHWVNGVKQWYTYGFKDQKAVCNMHLILQKGLRRWNFQLYFPNNYTLWWFVNETKRGYGQHYENNTVPGYRPPRTGRACFAALTR